MRFLSVPEMACASFSSGWLLFAAGHGCAETARDGATGHGEEASGHAAYDDEDEAAAVPAYLYPVRPESGDIEIFFKEQKVKHKL